MLPIKLIMRFAKLANKYKGTILHAADTDLLTADLGDALRRQKKIILDPDMGSIETATEVLPVIAEVKLLTTVVAKKLEIDTKGKSTIQVLEEVVKKTEANDSTSAQEIKNTLDWTRTFFANPEIQKILSADLIEIEKPSSLMDLSGMGRMAGQTAIHITQELSRLNDFLSKAKTLPETKPKPPRNNRKKGGPAPG